MIPETLKTAADKKFQKGPCVMPGVTLIFILQFQKCPCLKFFAKNKNFVTFSLLYI